MIRFALIGLLLFGCDVYDASLVDGGNSDASSGCPRGLADCDGDGACESDLSSRETCGRCTNVCAPDETCVASFLCASGDVVELDVGIDVGTDAGNDSGMDAGDTGPDVGTPDAGPPACGIRPPPRPSIADGADMSNFDYALRDIVVDQSGDRWEMIGYDLDGQCTDSIDDPFLCTPPTEPLPPFDGPMGVDNTFGDRVLSLIGDYDPSFQDTVRAAQAAGNTAMVIIKDWNGEPNDPRVDVNLIRVLGVMGGGDPQWDGSDQWIRSRDSYDPGSGDPLLRDENAYVADNVLVARFPDRQPIVVPWINEARFTVRFTDSVLTGVISEDRSRMDPVIFQGRFPRVDLEAAFDESGFCEGGAARGFVELELDKGADIRALPGSGGPGVTCDAVSAAFQYTGILGNAAVLQDPPLPDPVVCLP